MGIQTEHVSTLRTKSQTGSVRSTSMPDEPPWRRQQEGSANLVGGFVISDGLNRFGMANPTQESLLQGAWSANGGGNLAIL